MGLVDGIKSYADGLAELSVHNMVLAGMYGETAATQAQGYAKMVGDALDWAANNPKQVNSGLYTALDRLSADELAHLRAEMGARVAFGSLVSIATSGLGFIAVPAAAYGNMLEAARRGGSYLDITKKGDAGS